MKEIPTTRGHVALVSGCDFERTASHKWCACPKGGTVYVRRGVGRRDNHRKEYLHRFIVGATPDEVVDHINGNGLDNRRENLRICTHAQNCRGFRTKRKGSSSPYRGVYWDSRCQKWAVKINTGARTGGRYRALGRYLCEQEAARAYDAAAIQEFGKFAQLNFPT